MRKKMTVTTGIVKKEEIDLKEIVVKKRGMGDKLVRKKRTINTVWKRNVEKLDGGEPGRESNPYLQEKVLRFGE